MSAAIFKSFQDQDIPDTAREPLAVISLYEEDADRELALHVCNHLRHHLGPELELCFSWWRIGFLKDTVLANQALDDATHADVMIVALDTQREISWSVRSWFERWLAFRHDRERLLVDLTRTHPGLPFTANPTFHFLHNIAHRAKMDYLTNAERTVGQTLPHSFDDFHRQTTAFQDSWPEQDMPPSHFGLNE